MAVDASIQIADSIANSIQMRCASNDERINSTCRAERGKTNRASAARPSLRATFTWAMKI
jgi:hypothetical protein